MMFKLFEVAFYSSYNDNKLFYTVNIYLLLFNNRTKGITQMSGMNSSLRIYSMFWIQRPLNFYEWASLLHNILHDFNL